MGTQNAHPGKGVPSCIHPHSQCTGMAPFGNIGELYPRFVRLPSVSGGGALLTFTVRCGMHVEAESGQCNSTFDGHGLGLRAIVSRDDGVSWDLAHDRFIVSTKDGFGVSGGGYGNTLPLSNGDLISVYSYNNNDTMGKHRVEAVRWRLPLDSSQTYV